MSEADKYLPITAWAEEDRPREKLMLKGKMALSDAELLAILLATGSGKESAVDIAKRILGSVKGSLNELGKCSITDLQKFRGIGEAKAITILAAMELGRRRQSSEAVVRQKLFDSKQYYDYALPYLADLPYEAFLVIFCSANNSVIHHQLMSIGGIGGTVVDVRLILKVALEKLCTYIIVAHNHPSGSTLPSDADIKSTKKLKEAGLVMDVHLKDHIIIGDKNYYSFFDEGKL